MGVKSRGRVRFSCVCPVCGRTNYRQGLTGAASITTTGQLTPCCRSDRALTHLPETEAK